MVRDVTEGKTDYSLIMDGPMFERWAAHLTAGARKYDKRNWMKAAGTEESERFRESALRHFVQWMRGETDEDHAAAVFFNINGAEYVKERLTTFSCGEDCDCDWPCAQFRERVRVEIAASLHPPVFVPEVPVVCECRGEVPCCGMHEQMCCCGKG